MYSTNITTSFVPEHWTIILEIITAFSVPDYLQTVVHSSCVILSSLDRATTGGLFDSCQQVSLFDHVADGYRNV